MKPRRSNTPWAAVLALAILLPLSSSAGLVILPGDPIPAVFGGSPRQIRILIQNRDQATTTAMVRFQIFQAASSLAAPIGEPQPWKRLAVLSGQTLVDSILMTFPLVKGKTRFLVRWSDEAEISLGLTEVLVYPTNLLFELKPLAGGRPLGLYDPSSQIKPLLREMNIEFDDLENSGLERFTGGLAILGPFIPDEAIDPAFIRLAHDRAKAGVNLVFLTPMARGIPVLEPATVIAGFGTGFIVTSRSAALTHFHENPVAQLNLVRLARVAVKREQPDLLNNAP